MPERRVRIYPTGDFYLPGVPAQEMLVDPELAEEYTSGPHPAFTRQRPADQKEPSDHPIESPADVGLGEFPEA